MKEKKILYLSAWVISANSNSFSLHVQYRWVEIRMRVVVWINVIILCVLVFEQVADYF
jgi:hypothetical protein